MTGERFPANPENPITIFAIQPANVKTLGPKLAGFSNRGGAGPGPAL